MPMGRLTKMSCFYQTKVSPSYLPFQFFKKFSILENLEDIREEKINPELKTHQKEETPEHLADLEANLELDHEPEEEEVEETIAESEKQVEVTPEEKVEPQPEVPHASTAPQLPQQFPMNHRPPFRPQKFQSRGWNNGMQPRWQFPGQRPPPMMHSGPPGRQPAPQMRPFPPQRPFFNMPPGNGPPRGLIRPQRFFYRNPPPPQQQPYAPTPIQAGSSAPGMPRKVLINPNFKGGVEAVKSESKIL